MPLQRVNVNKVAMRHINLKSPTFIDGFHNVCQMIDAFNNHMLEEYITSWLNCLNVSMN